MLQKFVTICPLVIESKIMKKATLLIGLLVFLFAQVCRAEMLHSPLAYLNAMNKAHQELNYEQLYLLQDGDKILSLRYRHAQFEGKQYAQLLKLDNLRHEVILQDKQVAYFGDFAPFSLSASHISDFRPSVLHTDFNQLSGYTFLDLGRNRVANRTARVIRIAPNDDFRYQYLLWIDEENYLLLKSELLDREQNLLEEFRVIESTVDAEFHEIVQPIMGLRLPPLMTTADSASSRHYWRPRWLPKGFSLRAESSPQLSHLIGENEAVESQFYSDGLFSFTIYLTANSGVAFEEQFWREGKQSVYSQTIGDKDVIVIGDIPLASARHIVQEIELSAPLVEGGVQ